MCSHVFTFGTMWCFVINLRLLDSKLGAHEQAPSVKQQSISWCLSHSSRVYSSIPPRGFAHFRCCALDWGAEAPLLGSSHAVEAANPQARQRDKWPSPKHVEFPRGRVDAPNRRRLVKQKNFMDTCCSSSGRSSATRPALTMSLPPLPCRQRFAAVLASVLSLAVLYVSQRSSMQTRLLLDGQDTQRAGIYVWDPAVELPGLPPCDHEDPTSFAPVVKHLVLRRFPKLAECHEEYQYASAWYFERALLRAHQLLAPSPDRAEVVLIASSCYYEAAFWSR